MDKQKIITGYLLLLAAGTFWTGWFLMPDAGTTDTEHILKIVKESRTDVFNSVVMQITSCVLYLSVLFRLAQHSYPQNRATLIGITLFGIGVMGLCADAFFHLLAYFMTDDSVDVQQDVVRVMELMQTTGISFLIPILLPFFVGSFILSISLKKQAMISKISMLIFIGAFVLGITGGVVSHAIRLTIPGLALTSLTIFAAGHACMGMELVKSALEKKKIQKTAEPNYKYELLSNSFTSSN